VASKHAAEEKLESVRVKLLSDVDEVAAELNRVSVAAIEREDLVSV